MKRIGRPYFIQCVFFFLNKKIHGIDWGTHLTRVDIDREQVEMPVVLNNTDIMVIVVG